MDHASHSEAAVRKAEVLIRARLRKRMHINGAGVGKCSRVAIHIVGGTKLLIGNARCATGDAMAATGPSPPHRIADRNIELIRVKRETRTYRHFENLPGRRWHSIGHRPAILINNSDNCCVGLFKCRGNCDGACVCADWGCAKQRHTNESVQLAERGSRSGLLFHRRSRLKKDVFTRRALKMSRDFRHCNFPRNHGLSCLQPATTKY